MLSCWLSYQLMLDIRWSIKIQWFCWWERERNYIYIYVILQCWGCLVWKTFCENFLLLNWYITLPSCCHKSWGQYMFQIPGKWEWSLSFCPHDSRRVELRRSFSYMDEIYVDNCSFHSVKFSYAFGCSLEMILQKIKILRVDSQ